MERIRFCSDPYGQFFKAQNSLSTEWVDYVEEPMKYQALRPHFSLWVGGWSVLGVGWWLVVSWVGLVVVLWGVGGLLMWVVYRMGRLCGGAHEISGILAPLCPHGWVVGGFTGWMSGGGVGGVLVRG